MCAHKWILISWVSETPGLAVFLVLVFYPPNWPSGRLKRWRVSAPRLSSPKGEKFHGCRERGTVLPLNPFMFACIEIPTFKRQNGHKTMFSRPSAPPPQPPRPRLWLCINYVSFTLVKVSKRPPLVISHQSMWLWRWKVKRVSKGTSQRGISPLISRPPSLAAALQPARGLRWSQWGSCGATCTAYGPPQRITTARTRSYMCSGAPFAIASTWWLHCPGKLWFYCSWTSFKRRPFFYLTNKHNISMIRLLNDCGRWKAYSRM